MALEHKHIKKKLPKKLIRRGYFIVFICLSLIVATLYFIEFKETVTGKVVLTSEVIPYEVFTQQAGRLRLLVTENQGVRKNDPVAYLENEVVLDDFKKLQKDLERPFSANEFLEIDIENLKVGTLIHSKVQDIFRAIQKQKNFILNEKSRDIVAKKEKEADLLRAKIEILHQEQSFLKEASQLAKERKERNEESFKADASNEIEVEAATQDFLEKSSDLEQNRSQIKDLEMRIETIAQEILALSSRTQMTKATDDLNVKQSYRRLKDAMLDWEKRYVLKSEIDGTCVLSDPMMANVYLKENTKIMTVRPKRQNSIKAIMQLPILNSGKVQVDQEVNVKLANYPFKEYGVLKAKIAEIGVLPNAGNYNVHLSFPKDMQTTYDLKLTFEQLLEGEGEIIIGRFSLLARIWQEIRSERLNE